MPGIAADWSENSGAVFSDDQVFRYLLWRAASWAPATFTVGWIMLNPSTAGATVNDPTIRRCDKFCLHQFGCGRFVVANLSAFRSTDPRALRGAPRGDRNEEAIRYVLGVSDVVVCAWGNQGVHYGYQQEFLAQHGKNPKLRFLGPALTKAGAPRHPLYTKSGAPLTPFC